MNLLTEYKYIRMIKLPKPGNRKTDIFRVVNKKTSAPLGTVQWYSRWRQYCYFPLFEAVYSAGCLNDIADFIRGL